MVIQLKLPTDSMAKEYTYKVDASIHEEPFSGKFHWDSAEKDGADIECSFSRGSRGYAHMESVSGNGLNVIYRLPIFVKHHVEESIFEVCIPYSSENLRFLMDSQENLTYISGGSTSIPFAGISNITKIIE